MINTFIARSRVASSLLVALAAASVTAQDWSLGSPGVSPPSRAFSAAAVDPFRGLTLLFGGSDGGGLRGDTWEWNGAGWQQRVTPVRPSPRRGHGMAFDLRRQRVLLFGGFDASGPRNDTWEWDGLAWSLRSTATAPSARGRFGLAYDAARSVTVLFGGEGVGGALANDTWEWDGVQWSLRAVAAAPAARSAPAMAWDETGRNVLLFGGGDAVQSFGDTWRWNGANWSPAGAAVGPAPRADAAFAFDGNCGRGVLFGGRDVATGALLADAWEWNGVNWAPLAGVTPSARAAAVMVHDAQSGGHVLFGGEAGSAFLADTWTLGAPCSRQMSVIAGLVIGSTGILRYDYPARAGFQHYCLTLLTPPTQTSFQLAIPGFLSIGQTRIDVFSILLDPQEVLDGSGVVTTPVMVPNAPSLIGAGIDVQAVDLDFATATLRWAANDLALTILPQTPVASFSALPPSGPAPLLVQFTNNSLGATSYLWDFGDGTTSTLANPPAKSYVGGTYTVQLTASSQAGSSTAQQAIVVSGPSAPPTASFAVTPTAGNAPLAVAFTDTSTQQPTAWQWDFDADGVVDATQQNPTWTYTQAGIYTVRLTATNALGSGTATVAGCVVVGANQVVLLTEDFNTDLQLDADASAASWSGGFAQFFAIGGDGRHGPFRLSLCTDTLTTIEGKRVYTLDTDSTIIPGSNTATGNPIAVTDGRFFFTTMVVPSDCRIRFLGSQPPQITVAGRFDVLGHLDVAGVNASLSVPGSLPGSTTLVGAPGTAGGAGGGAGGKGGDKVTQSQAISTGATASNNGVNGQDARVLAGHAYGTAVANTGGRGSVCFPASGLNSGVYYGFATTPGALLYSPMTASGGGGGGYLTAGLPGAVITNNHTEPGLANLSVLAATATTVTAATAGTNQPAWPWLPNRYAGRTLEILIGATVVDSRAIVSNSGANNATFTVNAPWTTTPAVGASFRVVGVPTAPLAYAMGPNTNGGVPMTLFPIPTAPGSLPSSQHFLVGGSGGGGGGSHASFSLSLLTDRFIAGCGGGGGGGAISLRAGRILTVAPAAKVLANGGSALNSVGTTTSSQQACVGGGGSGGSVVLQSGNAFQTSGGLIDVRGGTGGTFQRSTTNPLPPAGASVQMQGGNGASGFVRFEAPTVPPLAALSGMLPAAGIANVGALAEVDQLVVTQSRFYATASVPLPTFLRYEIHGFVDGLPFVLSDDPSVSPVPALAGAPIRASFQAASLDATGAVVASGPWREAVRSTPGRPGIDGDGHRQARFRLVADRAIGGVITVDRVVIAYRN